MPNKDISTIIYSLINGFTIKVFSEAIKINVITSNAYKIIAVIPAKILLLHRLRISLPNVSKFSNSSFEK